MELGLGIGILIMLSFNTFYCTIGVKILEDILLEIRKIRFLKEKNKED